MFKKQFKKRLIGENTLYLYMTITCIIVFTKSYIPLICDPSSGLLCTMINFPGKEQTKRVE